MDRRAPSIILAAALATALAVPTAAAAAPQPDHDQGMLAAVARHLELGGHYPQALSVHSHARDAGRRSGGTGC